MHVSFVKMYSRRLLQNEKWTQFAERNWNSRKKKNTGTYSSWKAINEEHMLNDRMRSAEVDAEAQRVWSTVSPPDKKWVAISSNFNHYTNSQPRGKFTSKTYNSDILLHKWPLQPTPQKVKCNQAFFKGTIIRYYQVW